jgi:hypothetical protein
VALYSSVAVAVTSFLLRKQVGLLNPPVRFAADSMRFASPWLHPSAHRMVGRWLAGGQPLWIAVQGQGQGQCLQLMQIAELGGSEWDVIRRQK